MSFWLGVGFLVGFTPVLLLGGMLGYGIQCLHPRRPVRHEEPPAESAYWPSERPTPAQIVVVPIALPHSQVQYLPYLQQQSQPRVIDVPAIEWNGR